MVGVVGATAAASQARHSLGQRAFTGQNFERLAGKGFDLDIAAAGLAVQRTGLFAEMNA